MENPQSLPRTPKNPPKKFKNKLEAMHRPVRSPLTPPPAPGFTRKRMAKALANLGDDDDGTDKKVTEKPASPVQASAGLLDYDKKKDKKVRKLTSPVLQSPIWKNYKEEESAKVTIEAQVINRLVEESSTTTSSVNDAWTQTDDSFYTTKETCPTTVSTDSSSNTHTVFGDESDDCQDDSSATSVAESIPATEVFALNGEDSVMEDVVQSVESISEEIIQESTEIPKSEENEVKPSSFEKWFGTSFYARNLLSQDNCERQSQVEGALNLRNSLIEHLAVYPYNPTFYADLAAVYNQLGFADVAAGNAYKAILLVECALSNSTTSYPSLPHLREEVLKFMSAKHATNSATQVDHALNEARSYAYKELLFALMYSGAFWDGLIEAMKAKKLYPHDAQIIELMRELKAGYQERIELLANPKSKLNESEQNSFSKKGKIIIIKYPWLDEKLFFRTPEMLREVNKSLDTRICEVRPVVFRSAAKEANIAAENTDVGALGVFATRDIPKGEMVMVDHTLLSITNVPGSKKHHCEACQAFLLPPYFKPQDKVYPKCCKSVAYCSIECRDSAAGFHSKICGKKLDYLYQDAKVVTNLKSQNKGYLPRSLLLCRFIAVILPEIQRTGTHPLQHNLAARLVPNYSPADVRHEEKHSMNWLFKENVVAPTKFLLQIGVDIFRTRDWDPEIIQTLDWRIQNNASMGVSSVYPEETIEFQKAKENGIDNFLNTCSINPKYIFFNHSCWYNLYWNSSTECSEIIESMIDMEGKYLQPGNSAVRCFTKRDIKNGEEFFISYVGDAGVSGSAEERKQARDSLAKWFPGGCGCDLCEEENRIEAEKRGYEKEESEDEDMDARSEHLKTESGVTGDTETVR